MKRIVSVSIGSSSRDKSVQAEFLGEKYLIERIGTDGDIRKAIDTIKELDGKVDAFGMGGIDLYLTVSGDRKYVIREALPIKEAARRTPMVDGSGVKNTLEKKVIQYLKDNHVIELENKKVLITSAADRFKMAETFIECGSDVTIGDFIFALGVPLPLKNIHTFRRIADAAIPLVCRLPFEMLYPTGDKQKKAGGDRFARYYHSADIIAGDYHYIKKYMPGNMEGKVIVTNTVTAEDMEMLKKLRVKTLVTTTPDLDGRSFGTNVIEALLVSISGKRPEELTENHYLSLIEKLDLKPRVEILN